MQAVVYPSEIGPCLAKQMGVVIEAAGEYNLKYYYLSMISVAFIVLRGIFRSLGFCIITTPELLSPHHVDVTDLHASF